jgi:hypothetical protein
MLLDKVTAFPFGLLNPPALRAAPFAKGGIKGGFSKAMSTPRLTVLW